MPSEDQADVIRSLDKPTTADKKPETTPTHSLTAEERKARQKAAREAARAAWKAAPLAVKIKACLVLAFFGSPAILAILVGLMAVVVPRPLVQLAAWAEPATGAIVGLVHQPVVRMPPSGSGQQTDAGGLFLNNGEAVSTLLASPEWLDRRDVVPTGGRDIFLDSGQPASAPFAPSEWFNRRDVIPIERRDVDDLVIAGDMVAVSLVMICLTLFVVFVFVSVLLRRNRLKKARLQLPFFNKGMSRAARAGKIVTVVLLATLLLGLSGYGLNLVFYTGDFFWSAELSRHNQVYGLGTLLIRTGRVLFGLNMLVTLSFMLFVLAIFGIYDFIRDLAAKPATD